MTGRGKLEQRDLGCGNTGFTLVELMIGLLVLSVLLAVGAPAFSNLIKNNRMLSEVYALRATLNNARSKALAERVFVTVCPSSDGSSCTGDWHDGYIGFTDSNGNGTVDNPTDPAGDRIFVGKQSNLDKLSIAYNDETSGNRVRFNSRGYATGFSGTFTICDDRGDDKASGVIVALTGSVRAAVVDPNDPGADTLASCP